MITNVFLDMRLNLKDKLEQETLKCLSVELKKENHKCETLKDFLAEHCFLSYETVTYCFYPNQDIVTGFNPKYIEEAKDILLALNSFKLLACTLVTFIEYYQFIKGNSKLYHFNVTPSGVLMEGVYSVLFKGEMKLCKKEQPVKIERL